MTWSSRPRHGWDDVVTLVWRQRLLIVVVFAVLFALGALAALMLPRTYTAYSSLLVQMTQEYVYGRLNVIVDTFDRIMDVTCG